MSKQVHYIFCKGDPLTVAECLEAQERLCGYHGFADFCMEGGKGVKYTDITIKSTNDSRDQKTFGYRIMFGTRGWADRIYCTQPTSMMGEDPLESYTKDGITHEIRDGSVSESILTDFKLTEAKSRRKAMYSIIGARFVTTLFGDYRNLYPNSNSIGCLGDRFGNNVVINANELAVLNTQGCPDNVLYQATRQNKLTKELVDKIEYLLVCNEDAKGNFTFQIVDGKRNIVFNGIIRTQFHFGLILDALGIVHVW